MEFTFVYITCPDKETAIRLAKGAVEAKLAACANILTGMISVYEWENALQTDEETVLLIKTRRVLTGELTAWIENHHPYSVPCIVQLPITDGNASYLKWLADQTRDPNGI